MYRLIRERRYAQVCILMVLSGGILGLVASSIDSGSEAGLKREGVDSGSGAGLTMDSG